MHSSNLAQRFSYFIQAFSNDFFAMFLVDLEKRTIELLKYTEPVVPFLNDFMTKNDSYSDCIDFFCRNYVLESEREVVSTTLSSESLKTRLTDYGILSHKYHHQFHGHKYPTEVTIVDTSEKHNGIQCIIMLRFVENLVRQQEALKKQDDMVKTLIRDYNEIYHIDLDKDSFIILQAQNVVNDDLFDYANKKLPYSKTISDFVYKMVCDNDKEMMLRLTSIDYIKKQLEIESSYSYRYRVTETRGMQYFEMRISRAQTGNEGFFVIMTVRNIDEEVNEEQRRQKEIELANNELKIALEKEKMYQAELKRSMEAAEIANKAKTDFLSRMSHDIRTPMNAIIGLTAIAGANVNDTEKIKNCLEKISTSSKHLLGIINDILDMSRIEAGKFQIHEENFNISKIFGESMEIVKPQIRKHKHNLKVYIQNIKHENVIGDQNRIQQVFNNILSNAVKYTPDGGEIIVSANEKKSHSGKIGTYIFKFSDNGIGMSKEFLDKIFQPFEREEDLRTSKVKGSGLGMAIAQNIMQMMGGTLEVESEYGKGSTFTVTLPLKLDESKIEDSAELAGLPVLVADDDQIVCESTCIMLNEIGMEGDWVLSGKEAVEKVVIRHDENDDYFAVILDWKMPDMDGLETLKTIRAKLGPEIPIIIFSSYDWTDIEIDAKAAGANAFMSKPLFKSSLVKVFQDIMHPKHELENKNDLQILEKNDFSKYRLLLVEDNEINLEIMKEIVAATKAKIETAEDGKIALEMFQKSPENYYDMILMDVQMPNMNGHQTTRAIRALERPDAKSIPIIALTANTFEEDIHEALKAGMNEHLAKPIEIGKLAEVMERWLR